VGALADEEVGHLISKHCICAYQKVGTFQIVNGQKQGGNVASYFCLSNGRVLHCVAGPVDAETMLREARWVIETRNLARFESGGYAARYVEMFQRAHIERLEADYGVSSPLSFTARTQSPWQARFTGKGTTVNASGVKGGSLGLSGKAHGHSTNQVRVHELLSRNPVPRIQDIYRTVFQSILGEQVSTLPVQRVGH
jgi:hypothetical protein